MGKSVGEQFITEVIHDFVRDELDKIFGKQEWTLEMEGMKDLNDCDEIPTYLLIDVIGIDNDVVGKIEVSKYDYLQNEYRYPEPQFLWKVIKINAVIGEEIVLDHNNKNRITIIKKSLEGIMLQLDNLK